MYEIVDAPKNISQNLNGNLGLRTVERWFESIHEIGFFRSAGITWPNTNNSDKNNHSKDEAEKKTTMAAICSTAGHRTEKPSH